MKQHAQVYIKAYDFLSLILISFIFVCAAPAVAFAYVDPSVMTYTIQALAGVAVALSAVAGVALRKTRKFLLRLLDIDENRHRVVDTPVIRTDDPEGLLCATAEPQGTDAQTTTEAEGESGAPEADSAQAKKKHAALRWLQKLKEKLPFDLRPYKPKWKTRALYALLAAALTVGTIFIMAPLEIVGGSAGSLVFSFSDIWWIPTLCGLGIILALTLALTLFRGRLYMLLTAGVASIGLCAYVQTLFLNIDVPIANGDTIVWGEHAGMMTVCTVVWTALIVICIIASQLNLRRSQGVIACVSVCLLVVQTVGVISLVVKPAESTVGENDSLVSSSLTQSEAVATEEGLYTVSSKDNVIVFVLDTYDTATLKSLLNSNPDLLENYTGFTCFTNVTGSMIPTHYAIPALITGQLPVEGEAFSTYVKQRYARSTLLSDLAEAGYSVGLYSDSLEYDRVGSVEEQYEQVTSKTMNIHSVSSSTISFEGTLSALWQMALYRDLPWSLKPEFWYYTDQINKAMVHYDADAPGGDTVYIMDDSRYYTQLCNKQLSIDENDASTTGAFRFIHLLGDHYPYNIDEQANYLGTDQSTKMKQAVGALHIVSEYITQLKEMGLYDEATIIVTADHGTWTLTNDPLTSASCPILLVKPSQTAEEAAADVVVSTAPVSHSDIHATLRQSMGLKADTAGESVFDIMADEDASRTRYYYTTCTVTRKETAIVEYAISGDAGSIKNWTLTGTTWDPQE